MRNILFLGLVSFFMDISTEMVYPLLPLYLTGAFGATPALVGIIEGIAESTASLLKVFSGFITDRYQKKKPLAFIGYAAGCFYKIALLLASGWPGILTARVVDRLGKGIRTAPRDVMLSESAESHTMGQTFGIHKALDMAGSAIGIFLAWLLLKHLGNQSEDYQTVFLVSLIPAGLSLLMFGWVKEKKEPRTVKPREAFWHQFSAIDSRLKRYLLIVFLFTLGNSSNTFLLLRAQNAGIHESNVILLYFLYNLSASLFSIYFGKLSDKIGRKQILIAGYLLFSLIYAGFAFAVHSAAFIILFLLYGIFIAMTSGAERAMIAEIAPKELKGTMLGLHSTIVGVALFPASVICGFLWNHFGPAVPFAFGAFLSALAALSLGVFCKNPKQQHI